MFIHNPILPLGSVFCTYFLCGVALVIAYVDRYQDDTLYFIQTVAHRQEIWSQQKLVRIVADNWPDAIEKYRIKGVAGLTEKINDHGYSQLRKANANTFVDLGDGRVYCGANYGLTTAGTSVRATIHCQNMIRAAQATERFIQVNADSICRCIDDATGRKTREYCLGLIQPCNRDYIFTVNNGFAFLRIIWTDEGKMTIRVCEDIELINT